MKNEHTPGPWVIQPMSELDGSSLRITTACEQEWEICHLCDGIDDNFRETMASNARLIAAAPELLETLKMLLTWSCGMGMGYIEASEKAEKLIFKIEGDEFNHIP